MDTVNPELAYQQADDETERAVAWLSKWKNPDGPEARRQPWETTPEAALRPVARELLRLKSIFGPEATS